MLTTIEFFRGLLRGRRFYLAVATCCILEWLALRMVAPNCWFDSDTVSYFYPVNLFLGRISPVRPPVYCLFLNALRHLGDIHLKTVVVSSQFAALYVGIMLAAKMLRSLFRHGIPVLVACAYLALQGYFWAKAILPECFTFCTVVLAVYLYWRMTLAPSKKLALSVNLLVAFAILLKPVFLVLAIALLLAWGFRFVSGDKRCLKTIVLSYILSLGIVTGYCSLMQIRHGFFGLSSVLVQNDLLNVVSSSAWTTCEDSPVKTLLSEELKSNKDTYYGVFAAQWAVKPVSGEPIDVYAICPEFLLENPNARYCLELSKQYDKGFLYTLDTLQNFIREAKRQPLFFKYVLQKLFIALGAPRGILVVPFWLAATSLAVSLARRDHLLFFANLLFLGFIASVVLKIDILYADADSHDRLLYPVYLIPWMDLLWFFKLAFPGRSAERA